MSDLGSAMFTSPSAANEANTPPVVGSVIRLMYGTPASASRPSAATVFASCISESVPSCIRAPPEADTTMSGSRSSSACSAARVTFSPTTVPIEPPMNAKSMTHSATFVPPIVPVPHTAASRMPVADARGLEPLGVRLLVDEAEHVDRLEPGVLLAEAVAVEQQREPRVDAQPEMVAAARADALVLLELLVVEHLPAVGTARPQVRRVRLAATAEGQLDRHRQPRLELGPRGGRSQASIAAPAIDTPPAIAPPMTAAADP